jgi:CRISPR-associated protein Csb1
MLEINKSSVESLSIEKSSNMVRKEDIDSWVSELLMGGQKEAVSIVRKECLIPDTGKDGVIFPPTFAPSKEVENEGESKGSDYIIDTGPDGKNIVLLDSVGSQANRMEALFLENAEYGELVPQVTITAELDGKTAVFSLLEAAHRAADSFIRFSTLASKAEEAISAVEEGDYTKLARFSPTSIVFGLWDSRGISHGRIKIPRAITSVVRGYDAYRLNRGAQFTPVLRKKFSKDQVEEAVKVHNAEKLSDLGLGEVPWRGPGGVIVRGDIVRESALSLICIKNLRAKENGKYSPEQTTKLQKYILGLALIAMLSPLSPEYRSGTRLVPDKNKQNNPDVYAVKRDGTIDHIELGLEDMLEFCKKARTDFFGAEKIEALEGRFEFSLVKSEAKVNPKKKTE